MGMTRQERNALHKKQERTPVGNGLPSVDNMTEGVPQLRNVPGKGLTEFTKYSGVLHEKVLEESARKKKFTDNVCFSLYASSNQTNIADGSDVAIVFGGEQFDVNGNCSSNIFTAPVNGLYFLHTSLTINQIDVSSSYYILKITTSNRNYECWIDDKDWSADSSYHNLSLTAIADMDASDTAYVTLFQEGSHTHQTDVLGDADNSPARSYFTGYLISAL